MERGARWTLLITSIAFFIVMLDNLVVMTALPVIRVDLHASLEELEWSVNAYTLTFAVLLLPGAALGDRFGRKRLFTIGLTIFTLASAGAALSSSMATLIAARGVQGLGGAILTPLTLTLLSEAFPSGGRGFALGVWSGISGIAVASGPLVGGAVVESISWEWIFWLNVPIGLAAVPLALFRLRESFGAPQRLDLRGLVLASAGLFGIVWGMINGNSKGWTSLEILFALSAGAVLVVVFVLWELRAPAPMLPMRFFRNRALAAANVASLAMYFGMFGSVFLLAQFLQTAQGRSPFEAGIRLLPWTAVPLVVAPIAGILGERMPKALMALGLALQAIGLAWLAAVISPTVDYIQLVGPFILSGAGMAMFFAPVLLIVLAAVRRVEEGQASGAQAAIRELGGVFGVAVLATVFASYGGYASAESFSDGTAVAVWVGAVVVAVGALACLAIPPLREREQRRTTAAHEVIALMKGET
jgi:EmrB/QacA subfamily drug resistance transporter